MQQKTENMESHLKYYSSRYILDLINNKLEFSSIFIYLLIIYCKKTLQILFGFIYLIIYCGWRELLEY